jgi:hypothetical protein
MNPHEAPRLLPEPLSFLERFEHRMETQSSPPGILPPSRYADAVDLNDSLQIIDY